MKNHLRTTCANQNSDSPKAVIIMGAGDATGSAIAKRFAREGFTACVSRRNIDKLEPLVKNIEDSGGRARAFATDARKEDQVPNLTTYVPNITKKHLNCSNFLNFLIHLNLELLSFFLFNFNRNENSKKIIPHVFTNLSAFFFLGSKILKLRLNILSKCCFFKKKNNSTTKFP